MIFNEHYLRQKGERILSQNKHKTFSKIINESNRRFDTYDIFLSHRKADEKIILGIKQLLEEEYNYTIYVDWIDDPQMSRTNVNKSTANTLRTKMRACKCLVYVYTKKSTGSKWMPWELGYMDGSKPNKCTIFAIASTKTDKSPSYQEQEYLNIYPPLKEEISKYNYRPDLFVYEDKGKIAFKTWMNRNNNPLDNKMQILYG